jgi:plastocyanin
VSLSTRRALGAASAVIASAALLLLVVGAGAAAASGNTVNIQEQNDKYTFVPGTLQVTVGTTVTWKNGSDAAHTVTADDDSTNSGTINPTASYTQTFNTTGVFAYHCQIHSYMHGTIAVLAAAQSPTATQTPPSTDAVQRPGAPGASTPWLSILAALAVVAVVGGWLVSRQLADRR